MKSILNDSSFKFIPCKNNSGIHHHLEIQVEERVDIHFNLELMMKHNTSIMQEFKEKEVHAIMVSQKEIIETSNKFIQFEISNTSFDANYATTYEGSRSTDECS